MRRFHSDLGLFRATNSIRSLYGLLLFGLIIRINGKLNSAHIDRLTKCFTIYEWNDGFSRVGSQFDGGYLVPRNWKNVDALFSPGVGHNSDFELEFANQSITCFLLDGSVNGPPINHPNFNFQKMFLGGSEGSDSTTLENWLIRSGIQGDNLFLSMDIEGSEYEVLLSVDDDTLSRFKYITIELHKVHTFLDGQDGLKIIEALEKLTKRHRVVNFHGNNFTPLFRIGQLVMPQAVELTLVREDQFDMQQKLVFPNKEFDLNHRNDRWYFELPIHLQSIGAQVGITRRKTF